MSDSITTKVDRSYLDDETRDDASRYLVRSGNADLLAVLGLAVEVTRAPKPAPKPVVDPVPALLIDGRRCCEKCREPLAKYRRSCHRLSCSPAAVRGVCGICGNRLPGHGVCRRSKACREAARERGEHA